MLGPTTSLAHFVWATDEDLDIVAGTGAVAIHCPGSNLRGASGICRVKDIMRSGGLVSFGTDGCSVGDNEDFLEELRLGAYLQRTTDDFTDHRIDSETLIRDATEVGAGPAGFAGRVGALVPGFEADLLCVRKDRIFFPRSRYYNASELDVLLDRANASDIEFVMVGGDIVVRDGVVLGVDEGRLRDRISELADRLYRPTTEADRRRELAGMMTPHIERLAQRWYSAPIDDPATPMNTRSAPRPRDY